MSSRRLYLPFRHVDRPSSSSSATSSGSSSSHDEVIAPHARGSADPAFPPWAEGDVAGREYAIRQLLASASLIAVQHHHDDHRMDLSEMSEQQRLDVEAHRQLQWQQQQQPGPSTSSAPPPPHNHRYNSNGAENSMTIDEQAEHLNRTPTPSDEGTGGDEAEDDAHGEPVGEGGSQRAAASADGADEEEPVQHIMDMSGEEYEPTEQEIHEYCEWLGLDMTSDKCLVWIAREALRAPLPDNWTMCYTDEREVYYFNVRTGESIWDHPMDAYYKSLYKEEKVKLDKKRKRGRSFASCLAVKPLAEFFSELSETCGLGTIILMEDESCEHGATSDEMCPSTATPPWHEVPDALVDPIDFRVFLDPVVLPTSGRTVSRHTIINNTWRDPFTREYCENRRLVPNVDKRSEVDRWLQNMTQAYVQRMRGGTISGLQRLASILPYLLDRDEEACVRGQTLVLGWLIRQVEEDRKFVLACEEASAAAIADAEDALAHRQELLPPKVSPREGAKGGPTSTTSRRSSNPAATKPAGPRNSVVAKSAEGPLALRKNSNPSASQRSSSVVPTVVAPSPTPPPPTVVTAFPPPRKVLAQLFTMLPEENTQQILLSLLTMSTSASREALLLLATHCPALMHRTDTFRNFDEDIRFVLRIGNQDLCEIAAAAQSALVKELQARARSNANASAESNDDSHNGSMIPPFPQYAEELMVTASPVVPSRSGASSSTGNRGQSSLLPLAQPPPPLPTSGRSAQHDTSTDLRPRESDVLLSFQEVLRTHTVTDSEKKLSLKWLMLLHTASMNEAVVHPISQLDLTTAGHVVLCCYASGVVAPTGTSPIDRSVYMTMLPRSRGWPLELGTLPEDYLRSLMELCALGTGNHAEHVKIMFELTLHGSERCMDVVVRHAEAVKNSVLHVLQSTSGSRADGVGGGGAQPSSPADLLAAMLIFHELATLDEVAAACSGNPAVALQVAYNLTPRLARSQWRPKHFHQTVTAFACLVEAHREVAWRVVDRSGLHFFIRELSKKKNTAAEVKAKIETLEASERQLSQSMTLARWEKLTRRLEHLRAVELHKILVERRAAHEARGHSNVVVTTPRMVQTTSSSGNATRQGAVRETTRSGVAGSSVTTGTRTPRTSVPRLSPRLPEQPTNPTPPPDVTPAQPNTSVEQRCTDLVELSRQNFENAARKQQDIIAQRASLLSQALVLLITVRLKPKQHHRAGAATAAAVALQQQLHQQGSFSTSLCDSPSTTNSAKTACVVLRSPCGSLKGPPDGGVVDGGHSFGAPRSARQGTPRQSDLSAGNSSAVPLVPPPAPLALPSLRAPRGTTTHAAGMMMTSDGHVVAGGASGGSYPHAEQQTTPTGTTRRALAQQQRHAGNDAQRQSSTRSGSFLPPI